MNKPPPTKSSSFKVENDKKLGHKCKGAPKDTKENLKSSSDFRLHTEQRATRRAMFNHSVATKFYLMELQRKQVEKVLKIIENEEKRSLRKEMVPRAQLMPYFDKPFSPQRSNRALTVPKEPKFGSMNTKCWSCMSEDEVYRMEQAFLWSK